MSGSVSGSVSASGSGSGSQQSTSTSSQSQYRRPKNVIFVFPGAGGPDDYTRELEAALIDKYKYNHNLNDNDDGDGDDGDGDTHTIVKTLDWQEFRGSLVTAAYDGEMFGQTIGSILCNGYGYEYESEYQSSSSFEFLELESVHCIGISVGGFAANACIAELNRRRLQLRSKSKSNTNVVSSSSSSSSSPSLSSSSPSPFLKLTLLDPFTSRGAIPIPSAYKYGANNFGKTADCAIQYLNTDDPVPTTNEPLPLCACVDVTALRPRGDNSVGSGSVGDESEIFGHDWPLVYYSRLIRSENKQQRQQQRQRQRGGNIHDNDDNDGWKKKMGTVEILSR